MDMWTTTLIIALTTAWLLVRANAISKALFPVKAEK
jgi:hypothetical protein